MQNGKPNENLDSQNRHFKSTKLSIKRLRSLQRQFEADMRREKFEHIISLHENDTNGFYALVRKQRNLDSVDNIAMNFNDKTAVTESEILSGWSKYVIELATPLEGINCDYDFKFSGGISGHRQRNSPFSEK